MFVNDDAAVSRTRFVLVGVQDIRVLGSCLSCTLTSDEVCHVCCMVSVIVDMP